MVTGCIALIFGIGFLVGRDVSIDPTEESIAEPDTPQPKETTAAHASHPEETTAAPTDASQTETPTEPDIGNSWVYLNPDGMTLSSRVNTPAGYTRPAAASGSLTFFLRNYAMKEHGAPVFQYDGSLKEDQSAHIAVFQLPLENEDFQQCADSVMRVYAEYFLSIGKPEKINFHYTTGFLAEYAKWRDGYRIQIDGNQASWVKSAGYDDSYTNFKAFMRKVFAYANTHSMDVYESTPITMEELQVGDVFLDGGFPGHVMLVVDICYNANGEKAFLLAQGHMPAQEFELMKNPSHEEDPWYYEDEIAFPLETDVHTFPEGSLQRLSYLD